MAFRRTSGSWRVKAFAALIALSVLGLLGALMRYRETGDSIGFGKNGKLELVRITMLHGDVLPLVHANGEWWFVDRDGQEKWLPTPYVTKWNDRGDQMILERSGRIYVVNKSKLGRLEVAFRNGEWRCKADGGDWYILGEYSDDAKNDD